MAASSSSSCAKIAKYGIAMILLVAVLWSSAHGVEVAKPPKCSGRGVNEAYSSDVSQLVQDLQQAAKPNKPATLTVGLVTGTASCQTKKPKDCTGCLGVATVQLAVDCKGKAVGKSTGVGTHNCKMSFRPA
ncbi:unnamed protein product [Linum tenue]|uniref:Gnk2-homologous domain-containing protein n=1 Tax=Linum tenue TaxID=586396 RepID=A0AAV0JW26_9ROSI|nr:unnamed protein product [Linum tenue]